MRNSSIWIPTFVAGLRRSGVDPASVWFVDNASADDTCYVINRDCPEASVLRLPENRGYGAAVNAVAALEAHSHVLALNVDTELQPDALRAMLTTLDSHPDCGVVAPRLINADGSLQASLYRFPTLADFARQSVGLDRLRLRHRGKRAELQRSISTTVRVDGWAAGAVLLISGRAWMEVDGFDEGYFFFVEEVDLQRRLADRGWNVYYEPKAEVVHHGGGRPLPAELLLEAHRGWGRYFERQKGVHGKVAARLTLLLFALIRFFAWSLLAALRPERQEAALWAQTFRDVIVLTVRRRSQ